MKNNSQSKWPIIAAGAIFIACLLAGYWLSQRKPLWNDEIYTQVTVIDKVSYFNLLTRQNPEGNNAPLFYIIQKAVCDLTGYTFPHLWKGESEWFYSEPRAQIILRMSSNVFMSLTIACIFYFFAKFYSGWTGLYGLVMALSTGVVWTYWVEARPYTLWVLLTTLQSLILLYMLEQNKVDQKLWVGLSGVHFLLSLTVILSLMQIVIASAILWLLKVKNWKKYIFLTLVPCGLCLFYYSNAPIVSYGAADFMSLIYVHIPRERLLIGIFLIIFFIYSVRKNKKLLKVEFIYLGFTVLLFAAAYLIYMLVMLKSKGTVFGPLPDRIFIHLMPTGIIAAVIFSYYLVQEAKNKIWLFWNINILLGGLLIWQALDTYTNVLSIRMY